MYCGWVNSGLESGALTHAHDSTVALFLRGLQISRNCPTVFGSVLGAGISIAIFMQALINMGMSIGLLPTKGLTLPLVSYGGSSLILVCFSLGILSFN